MQIPGGEWTGTFTLIRDNGEEINVATYYGSLTFPTREEAKNAALDAARAEIDKASEPVKPSDAPSRKYEDP